MWRNGSRVLLKLVFLLYFLAIYSFWNHLNWPEKSKTMYEENNGGDSMPTWNRDMGEFLQYSTKIVHSRHLLAELPNCTPRAVEQFPWDGLTEDQRLHGYIAFHILLALYMFVAISIVCDRYFVPALEVICELFDMESDVAGATFMAAGSSAPELATAVIGVFIAKADVGLSTVVGSAIYNVMFVISMSALFALSAVQLHWWPLFRDCIAYLVSVIALVLIIYDSAIEWYEPVSLLLLYAVYVVVMMYNQRLEMLCVPWVQSMSKCCGQGQPCQPSCLYEKYEEGHLPPPADGEPAGGTRLQPAGETTQLKEHLDHAHQEAETWHKLCERPEGALWTVLWVLSMPASVLLFLTVPDCRRPALRKLFWLSFLMSLIWLSVFCFIMVWMITVVGYTYGVPDSIMSLTFIAFGVSLPDVVASVLVVRDGLGDMAMSNAVGSNVFDILVCLGLPWFIETCIKDPGSYIPVYSGGLLYTSIMLLTTVAFLLLATHVNGWRLTKTYGLLLLGVYLLYTVLAALYETNLFGDFHPPECPSSY